MHQTKNLDDGYMGSGKLIKAAIQKYGFENFVKEILYVFNNEKDMKTKEKELVVLNEMSYNLCEGGRGGFSFINKNSLNYKFTKEESKKATTERLFNPDKKEKWLRAYYNSIKTPEHKAKMKFVSRWMIGDNNPSKRQDVKDKISKAKKGKSSGVGVKNSQYGTCWVTNGQENKKIKKEELDNFIELGYYKGRIL